MTRTQRLAAIVALVGLLAGVVAAVAIPRTTTAEARSAPPAPFARVAEPLTTAPHRDPNAGKPREEQSATLDPEPGSVAIELRRPDPAGGPGWAIRSFLAQEVYSKIPGYPESGSRSKTRRCWQLGREHDGQFGWVDGQNVFRRVLTTDLDRSTTVCGSRKLAERKEAQLTLTTLVGHPTQDDRAVLGTVVWGSTGAPLSSLTLRAAGRTDRLEQTSDGAFIALYGPDRSPADLEMTRRYADGSERAQSLYPRERRHIPARLRERLFPEVRPETYTIAARTSSPSGGPSIGFATVKSAKGVWCMAEQGTIVGDRIGQIDPDTGTMGEQDRTQPAGCGDGTFPPPSGTLNLASSYGADPSEGKLDPARAALRLQSGRSAMYGFARKDVELITFASSRDVRTIAPTGPAHAFIVAWDGDFAASGRVVITSHLKDGTTRSMTEDLTW